MRTRTPNFDELARTLQGRLVPRDAPSFASTLDDLLWNAYKPARSPDAIVTAASVQDVSRAVCFAREHGLKVAMRSSGHNYFGAPVREGGLLLDLGGLDAVEIDAQQRRARVQPGLKSGRFLSALIPLELAFPVGHAADVGLGGFLLNGGLGWNLGQWGPASESVTGVQIVLSSGELLYADAQQHADLFWAARGAGPGFFGAITSYEVALHALPDTIMVDSIAFDFASLDAVGAWLEDLVATAPPRVEIAITLGAARDPRLPANSPALAVTATAFQDVAQIRSWVTLLHSPPPAATVLGRNRCQRIVLDGLLQRGGNPTQRIRMDGDVFWSNATMRQLLQALQPLAAAAPSGHSYVMLQPVKMARAPVDSAFSLWGSTYVAAYAFWQDPADDDRCREWIAAVRTVLEPRKIGHYIGEADLSAGPERVRQCFSAAAYEKLHVLKHRYDPEDVFFSYLATFTGTASPPAPGGAGTAAHPYRPTAPRT